MPARRLRCRRPTTAPPCSRAGPGSHCAEPSQRQEPTDLTVRRSATELTPATSLLPVQKPVTVRQALANRASEMSKRPMQMVTGPDWTAVMMRAVALQLRMVAPGAGNATQHKSRGDSGLRSGTGTTTQGAHRGWHEPHLTAAAAPPACGGTETARRHDVGAALSERRLLRAHVVSGRRDVRAACAVTDPALSSFSASAGRGGPLTSNELPLALKSGNLCTSNRSPHCWIARQVQV